MLLAYEKDLVVRMKCIFVCETVNECQIYNTKHKYCIFTVHYTVPESKALGKRPSKLNSDKNKRLKPLTIILRGKKIQKKYIVFDHFLRRGQISKN